MSDWIKIITNPLGLAGFALFLVFGFVAKIKSRDERRWMSPVACGIAVLALVGGLIIAFTEAPRPQSAPSRSTAPVTFNCDEVTQQSSGAGSPNVNCANGNVNITVDQSNGTQRVKKQ
jgi:hypothetical protein